MPLTFTDIGGWDFALRLPPLGPAPAGAESSAPPCRENSAAPSRPCSPGTTQEEGS